MVEPMLKAAVAQCAAPDPLVEVRSLSVQSDRRPLLRDVSLRIEEGQVFGIIGPSGAGKSTLLRCLNRLVELTPRLRVTGDVLFGGRSIYRSTTPVSCSGCGIWGTCRAGSGRRWWSGSSRRSLSGAR
jgi:ABC-type glutathione transport system ATPase component